MAEPNQRKPSNPFVGDMAKFQAPEFAGAREAARGIAVGAGGAGSDSNVASVMGQFQQVGGGASGAQGMEMLMRTTQNLAQRNGMTYNEMIQMGRAGGQVGGQMGFDPRIGMATAIQAAGFGQAYQERGGQSSLAPAQARQLDQELRLSAARSPMANMLGAAMAMSETGMFKGKGGALGALSGNDPAKRQEALSQLARLNPAQFVDTMRQAGINPETASQFLGAQNANRDQIARHGIQDIVRSHQGAEVRGMMAEEMSGAFTGALRQAGVRDSRARRDMSMSAGDAIQQEMAAMAADPKSRNLSTEQRNQRLAAAANKALSGSGLNQEQVGQLTAGAVRSMEERVRADPDLRRFGDVQGLLNMNRGDVLQQGAANAAQAEAHAKANLGKAGPQQGPQRAAPNAGGGGPPMNHEQNELVKLHNEQKAADRAQEAVGDQRGGKGGAGNQQGGGGQQTVRIVGTLNVRADGSGQLDDATGVPVNE